MTEADIIETEVVTQKEVTDAEIDNLVGRGIVRVLRYIGNFVYRLADALLPMGFYVGILMLTMFNTQLAIKGVDAVGVASFRVWSFYVLAGITWLVLERCGIPENLAKWLKIDEI